MNEDSLQALRQCITGMTTREVTTEYVHDDDTGEMKISKQKVIEKNIPPNIDIIKMIYQQMMTKQDYDSMSDEDLLAERKRLLEKLRSESDSREDQGESKV